MKSPLLKITLAAAVCLAVPFTFGAVPDNGRGQAVEKKESLYNTIFVYQQGKIVTMRFSRREAMPIQTQVNLDNLRQHTLEYTKLTFCGLLYTPQPQRILVLGLGGGVIPRDLRYYFPEAAIDVAEIDEAILPLAVKYFAFREDDKLKVHVDDGRMFIKKQLRQEDVKPYDLVILDAFNGEYIPFHLMTREFLEEVKAILSPDGAVVANVFYDNRLFDAELATFRAVFERCEVFKGKNSGNAMLVSPGPQGPLPSVEELIKKAQQLQEKHRFDFNLIEVAKCVRPNVKLAPKTSVLTDDRAPVNHLREQKKEE